MRHIVVAFVIVFSGSLQVAVSQTSETAEATQQDSLDQVIADYEAFRKASDPSAAARGTGTGPVSWPDVSRASLEQNAREARALLNRLDAISTDRVVDTAILEHLLGGQVMREDLDSARIPFTGDSGFHASPVFAASRARIRKVEDADAYVARLRDTPRFFEQNIENMRRGLATGWTAHSDPLATVIEQVAEQLETGPDESDLFAPLAQLPESFSVPERAKLQREGREAAADTLDAYRDLHEFLVEEYAPKAREAPGLAGLRGGRRAYAQLVAFHTAGAGLSPEDIHTIGQAEVARIREEMKSIINEVGFEGDLPDFIAFLREDPRFYARTPQDLLEKASTISKRLDASLPQYFGRLPRLPYGVSPVPASIAPGYTTGRYAQGDPESGRSGTYLVNTYRLDQRPLYELPALTAHEAVPGHHLQIALAQEMRDVPDFRRSFYATAFGEGWALYAEKLAGEAGLYQTPYERFGALSYEMWRACRLVADTGLHWYGWSREQAEACFIDNTALSPLNIETEVTRYIGWPGQAVAYKVGELKILELRAEAEAALGADFDLRAFHDHLLGEGSMPLSTLQARMRQWISDRQSAPGAISNSRSP
ncbi:MAG: DUF885 domain-containing protein [Pseudomonadota bacterium]